MGDGFDDFSFDFDFDTDESPKIKTDSAKPEQGHIKVSHRTGNRHITRKAASEQALEDSLNWYFRPGDCYHCFSFGDVDSLSFFKHVLKQQRVEYLALSTWCMAGEDVQDLQKWYRRGMLGRVDLFLGEIFTGSYPEVYVMAQDLMKECGGRLVIFRNHAKIMAVKGERFDCLIESSANVNTNPRSENTVLTVDSTLVDEYITLFSKIIPFNSDYGADPYTV